MDGPKSPEERAEILSNMKQMRLVQAGIESPVAKAVMSGGMGECRCYIRSNSISIMIIFPCLGPLQRLILSWFHPGFAIGAFFSLMGSSFTIEDPFQQQKYQGMRTAEKAKLVFRDMGRGMWRQGLGFGKVGALYAGTECVVEGVSCATINLLDWPSLTNIVSSVCSTGRRTTFTIRSMLD